MDKAVIVSGGSKGLGKAIVTGLLNQDYRVATFSRSETDFLIETRTNTPVERFYWESVDLNEPQTLRAFVFNVYKQFGGIDALINNAGMNLDRVLAVTTDAEIHQILTVNLEATILLSRLVSRFMLQKSEGVIINISSILGTRGFKGTSVYSAAKAGLDGFTRSLARELGGRGIRVNAVAPGFLETDMTGHMPENQRAQIIRRTPLGRLGRPEDIVGLIKFLLSPEAGFITGQTITADGGLTC